jgi:hypothetical protein
LQFWAVAIFTAWTSAVMTGIAGGSLGDMLKAGLITGATALAFYEVGQITNFHNVPLSALNAQNTPIFAANIAGHAAVGCVSALASGGSCEAGALAAGAGAAAAPLVAEQLPNARTDLGQRLEGAAVSGLVGGLASIGGGGKFVDGAVTAAFGYLFNAAADCMRMSAIHGCFSGEGGVGPAQSEADSLVPSATGKRGLSELGGIFSSEPNAAGGTIWTSVGDISQNDVAGLVNGGLYRGEVNIISGVHGFLDGTTTVDLSLYEADVERFGSIPGVNVYTFSAMTPGQINGLLNGRGTTIGAFCNSGACLAPFR